MDTQSLVAIDALRLGISRCVTLSTPGNWDTHANNDGLQSPMWENLFDGLSNLMELLASTPGESAASMAEETTVVVLSEMGRTPLLNPTLGKDHWPHTSAMIIGPTVHGGRVIGGFDENYYGLPIDPDTAQTVDDGQTFSAEVLGATLLHIGGLDPAEFVRGVEPIRGVLL